MMNGKSLPMKGMSTATISAPMTVPGMAARKLPDARVELPPPLDRLCRPEEGAAVGSRPLCPRTIQVSTSGADRVTAASCRVARTRLVVLAVDGR